MKKILFAFIFLLLLAPGIRVQANNVIKRNMETTAYCSGEITASGCPVRYGICAVSKDLMYKTALVWDCNKKTTFFGYFECLDTGYGKETGYGTSSIFSSKSKGTIETGLCIDVYFENLEDCYKYMEETGGEVYVEFIDAVG